MTRSESGIKRFCSCCSPSLRYITVMDWVLSEKMALVSQNVLDDQRFDESESIRVNSLNSIICVPMMNQDNVTGLIYADSSDILEPLTRDDAAFTAAAANELALCMDNIRLQEQAIVNERMAAIGNCQIFAVRCRKI